MAGAEGEGTYEGARGYGERPECVEACASGRVVAKGGLSIAVVLDGREPETEEGTHKSGGNFDEPIHAATMGGRMRTGKLRGGPGVSIGGEFEFGREFGEELGGERLEWPPQSVAPALGEGTNGMVRFGRRPPRDEWGNAPAKRLEGGLALQAGEGHAEVLAGDHCFEAVGG